MIQEYITGEVTWLGLAIVIALNNLIMLKLAKGQKGDKGDTGPMGPMGIKGEPGKPNKVSEHLNSLETSFQLLTESDAYKEWKKKQGNDQRLDNTETATQRGYTL